MPDPTVPQPTADDERRALQQVTARLHRQFASHPGAEIERRAAQAYARLAGARVRQYVPLLVERAVLAELRRRPPAG